MPHEPISEQQVAAYLGMHLRDVIRLASREKIPARRVGDQKFQFRKSDVDHWVWEQMHQFDARQIASIEKGVIAHHGGEASVPIICPLIPDHGIALPLGCKTRQAALQRLVDRAEECELVYSREDLLRELKGREQLCSTALLPGIAFPHPRHPLPYDIAESFVIVGLCPQGVPFGAEDGSLTKLLFLLCGKDERTHLHVLARLVRMLDKPGLLDEILEMDHPLQLAKILAHREMEVIHEQA